MNDCFPRRPVGDSSPRSPCELSEVRRPRDRGSWESSARHAARGSRKSRARTRRRWLASDRERADGGSDLHLAGALEQVQGLPTDRRIERELICPDRPGPGTGCREGARAPGGGGHLRPRAGDPLAGDSPGAARLSFSASGHSSWRAASCRRPGRSPSRSCAWQRAPATRGSCSRGTSSSASPCSSSPSCRWRGSTWSPRSRTTARDPPGAR